MVKFSKQAFSPRRRQAGGTILGLIIGLIVGLGIAVVVAVMITKSTLPFTNKQAQPERAPGAAAGQIVDPNKPLYGNKEPAREAARSLARDPVPAPAAGDKPDTAVAPDNKAPVIEKSTPEKPKPEVAAARPADKAADKGADKAAADEKYTYFLQAGAFREPADAENARARLALLGFEAGVTERTSDSGPLYRVRIGPFNQLEVMYRARTKLSDNGVDVAVVRIAK